MSASSSSAVARVPPKTGECFSQTSVSFAVDLAVQSAQGVDRSTV